MFKTYGALLYIHEEYTKCCAKDNIDLKWFISTCIQSTTNKVFCAYIFTILKENFT